MTEPDRQDGQDGPGSAEQDLSQHSTSGPPDPPPLAAPSAAESLAAMWTYTLLRLGLFAVLLVLLLVARVPGLLAVLCAAVLSVPTSYVLLRRQRARLADNLDRRIQARQVRARQLSDRLEPGVGTAETRNDTREDPQHS